MKQSGKTVKRAKQIKLNSLTSVEQQQSLLYREARNGLLDKDEMHALSQLLHRLHAEMVNRMDLDLSTQILELEARLTLVAERAAQAGN